MYWLAYLPGTPAAQGSTSGPGRRGIVGVKT